MKLLVFSVYDSKAQAFAQPFVSSNESVAKRDFATAANDPASVLNMHPTDYSLHQVGEWDSSLGVLTPVNPSVNFGLAASFITVPKSENHV